MASARLVVAVFTADGQALTVAVDDTLFHRYGRSVFGAAWQHDGSAKGRDGIGRGNCFVIAGLVVTVPFTDRNVCLPLLLRLHLPGTSASKPAQARELVGLLAAALSDRRVHVVADAAYRARPGGPARIGHVHHPVGVQRRAVRPGPTTDRPPGTAGAQGGPAGTATELPPPPPGPRSRDPLPAPRHHAVAVITCLWYGSLRYIPVQVVLVRDPASAKPYGIALVSTDLSATPAQLIARYAARWSIEQAIKDGKDLLGVGEAHNRSRPPWSARCPSACSP